ncbi:MAG: endolytic transglycosylase MltG [Pseudomonadales bacterium]|nr:endolytic transglycosylase MltG [Pseudomonadales bacterium]
MRSTLKTIFYSCVIVLISAGLLLGIVIYQAVYQPLDLGAPSKSILVGQGETLTSVINRLAKEGVVRHPRWLLLFARLQKPVTMRVGEYELQTGVNGEGLLQKLASGRVIQYQVTFIEGSTLAENMKLLAAQTKLIDDVKDLSDEGYFKLMGFPRKQAEGWFFPDTYTFVSGMKVSDILRVAHNRMRSVLDEEWQKRTANLPYKNPHEALIMASIIEKETGVADERKQIAGVFVRRMKTGMKLQTDPTVIYGLGSDFKGNLKRSHLKEYTPWNTYVIDGLPPTPIAWPGRAAIHAALNPTEGKSIFFVARGDGTHVFSETLEQHQNAINEYQLRRKEGSYRSSPPTEGLPTEDLPTKDLPAEGVSPP